MTNKQIALVLSRELRKKQTKAEKLFWNSVRNRQVAGYKFYRQHPLFYDYYGTQKFFIADFYCGENKMVIEIDGGIHETQTEYDEKRTEIIEAMNIEIIRFKNEEVLNNLNLVLDDVKKRIKK